MKRRCSRSRGFFLLEAMIATFIFAIGVIALGHCVENCLSAQRIKEDDARARRLLENRMAEIEAGSAVVTDKATEELKGMFAGMTLKTTRVPLKKKNEKEQELFGLFQMNLQLTWKADGQEQVKELTFYVYPRQR
jgi:Tfp pilus assembly protein PilV